MQMCLQMLLRRLQQPVCDHIIPVAVITLTPDTTALQPRINRPETGGGSKYISSVLQELMVQR